ncbi:MAG: GHKL domain-containing protein [Lachnospiraceae bacterium]|nr:GHKL domain-containing protein [Lachnospiraceae bacterium]
MCKNHLYIMILALIGYIISVVYNYIALTIFEYITGINQSVLMSNTAKQWLFLTFYFTTLYLILRGLRFIIERLPKLEKSMFKQLSFILFIFLLVCAFILIFNFTYEYSNNYPQEMRDANLKLFLLFFVIVALILFVVTLFIYKDAKTNIALKEMEHLQKYTAEVEEMYNTLRSFKHDYNNVLCSMKYYIDNRQYEELNSYYEREVQPLIISMEANTPAIEQLSKMKSAPLKSILYFKILEAAGKDIQTTLEIKWPVEKINIKELDLTRIMGIILDNAIEATSNIEDSSQRDIHISCISSEENVVIIVKNRTAGEDINLTKIQEDGTSSKGDDRGIGLGNIKTILKKYDNILIQTSYIDNWFTQTLEILH